MKLELKLFQETAVEELTRKVRSFQQISMLEDPKAIVLSAPTGAGKTVIATTMIERILAGDDYNDPDQDAVFLWITDLPELNNQTYNKMINTSDILNTMNMEIIASSFNHRSLTPGKVYFLNTQKIGKDKLLTSQGDGRQYTIWQTIDNTIMERGFRFIVIIDEAHRGMRKPKAEEETKTIIQKFIKGNNTMRQAPLIIGISATPKRFIDLVDSSRGTEYVSIDIADVQNSGLIKDNIILHYSEDELPKDITLLREATRHWQGYAKSWSEYCSSEDEETVSPIFVVQVENAPKGKKGTRTPLDQVISAINEELPSPLPIHAFAHAFDETTIYDTGNRLIRYLAPSQITDDREVKVVFFKTALSTGWDCPRAETMMSFRKAQDATYIAQLIGRMVRTPLARRIDKKDELNSVSLFLPHYNLKAVNSIVEEIRDPEHEFIPPVEVESHLDSTILKRSKKLNFLFGKLEKIPSYVVPNKRRIKQTRRLMKMAQALVRDEIDLFALEHSKKKILGVLKKNLLTKREDSIFKKEVNQISSVIYSTKIYSIANDELREAPVSATDVAPENIDYLFRKSGRKLGEGLHLDFWELLVKGIHNLEEIKQIKIEIAVLLSDATILESIENQADLIVSRWRNIYNDKICNLPEGRIATYDEIMQTARNPAEVHLYHPINIRWNQPEDKREWKKHLYVDTNNLFFDSFNDLETEILEIEIEHSIGWLRNPVRKKWSLSIPYKRKGGQYKSLYPDFLFFRRDKDNNQIIIDILDPHGHHLDDALTKAQGMAQYAEQHGHHFGRIQAISKIKGDIQRLDLQDKRTRERLHNLTNNNQLIDLYEDFGIRG